MSLGGGQQMQELQQQIEALEAEREELEGQIEAFETEKAEIDEAIEAIEAIEAGASILVPVGGGARVHAQVEDVEDIVVSLGADFAAEKDQSGAVDTLEHKKEVVDERIEGVKDDISELEEQRAQLEQQAQAAQQQMMQQMQQQQQGE